MAKSVLNKKEKQEIVSDVKKAIEEAKGNYRDKKAKKITILSIIFVFIISFGFIYLFYTGNPRTLFKHSTEVFLKTVDSINLAKNNSIRADISTNVKIGNKELNKYNYKTYYLLDDKGNSSFLWKTYEGENLLSNITFSGNLNNYVYVSDLYDKYFTYDNSYFNYNYDDTRNIVDSLEKAFLSSINDYKISNSRSVIKINGKLINTYKTSLSLTKEEVCLLIDDMSNYLKDDVDFKTSFNKIISKKTFDSYFNELKDSFKDDNLKINIYTKGLERSFVRIEVARYKDKKVKLFTFSKIDESKYYIVFDNRVDLLKKEYVVSIEKNNKSSIYNINMKKENNKDVITDINLKIELVDDNEVVKELNEADAFSYNELSISDKKKVDEKLEPIHMFVSEIIEK